MTIKQYKQIIEESTNVRVQDAYMELKRYDEANFKILKKVFEEKRPEYDNTDFENFVISYAHTI